MRYFLKLAILLLRAVYVPMKHLPLKNQITMLSRQSDSPSPDFVLLSKELKALDPDLKVVFLCKTMGKSLGAKMAYLRHIFVQMRHIAASKAIVLDSYCIPASILKHREELKVFQIWHALGAMKKFGWSIVGKQEGRNNETAKIMQMHNRYDYAFASSPFAAVCFADAFAMDRARVLVNPLPRVDMLMDETWRRESKKRVYEACPGLGDKPVILYCPTFRMNQENILPFCQLDEMVDHDRFHLLISPHPTVADRIQDKIGKAIMLRGFSTVELAAAADYVITDYSAVAYEIAILNKPIFYWIYDYDSYKDDRSFYIDFMKDMPGYKSTKLEDILNEISSFKGISENISAFLDINVPERQKCAERMAKTILDLSVHGG